MDGLHAVLKLQDHDTEADQLRFRRAHLPERSELDSLLAEQREIETEGATTAAERDELLGRQAQLEADLGEITKRIGELDRQMRSGVITAGRDLQAMADQVTSMKRRQSDLEDAELEVMEALDPVEARVTALQERWATLESDATALRAVVAEAEVALDASLGVVVSAREAEAAALPADLLATYERLRTRLGGVGAAPLVGSSCGGCHLTLSASEVDRIRRLPADTVVTCEQCGRILVR